MLANQTSMLQELKQTLAELRNTTLASNEQPIYEDDNMDIDPNRYNKVWVNPDLAVSSTLNSQHAPNASTNKHLNTKNISDNAKNPKNTNTNNHKIQKNANNDKVQKNNSNIKITAMHPRPWNAQHLPQQPSYAATAATPATTSKSKPSYADIAQKLVANKPSADINAAKSALAFFHQRRVTANSSTEQRLGLRRIYVNGIPKTRYKELKARLYSLHFMLSKIINISYIAQNCVEFVVQEDYTSSFIAKCKFIGLQIIDADPTKPLDPNFHTDKMDDVKQLFAKRVANIIANTKNDIVKEFFTAYSQERQITLPTADTTMQME